MPGKTKISIVMPNFNGEAHLEKALLSIFAQQYSNLEFLLIDGGSSDDSREIIEKYSDQIDYTVSEKDRGNTHAINKGFRASTGEVMGWLNSDDILFPGALELVHEIFSKHPDVDWITGRSVGMADSGLVLTVREARPWSWLRFIGRDFRHIAQEATFWRRSLWDKAGGGLSENFGIASDFELWTRFLRHANLYSVDGLIGGFRFRDKGQLSRDAGDDNSSSRYDALCELALETLLDATPSAHLAQRVSNLPGGLPLQPSFTFKEVAPSLSANDPPILRSNWAKRTYAKHGPVPIAPESRKPKFPSQGELRFSGASKAEWDAGPNFAIDAFVGIDVEFSTDQVQPADPVMDDFSPPVPFAIGPVALYDRGAGSFELLAKVDGGSRYHPFNVSTTRPIHFKFAAGSSEYLVTVNGKIIAREAIGSGLQNISDIAVLGAGLLNRGWKGAFSSVTIYYGGLEDHQVRGRTIEHLEGASGITHVPIARPDTQVEPPARPARVISSLDADLSPFKKKHAGERCFVMGNGPSLNTMDLNLLRNDSVFACNAAFLLFERVDWRPKYYTCVDSRVLRDRASDIGAMLDKYPDMIAFFPEELVLHDGSGQRFNTRDIIPPKRNRYYFRELQNDLTNPPDTMFSLDANDYIVQPYTVTITMLQLAHYMGYSPIYLIGCDTSYSVMPTVKQEGQKLGGVGLLLTSTANDDVNHFDPRYFGAGREWHNPQVDGMMMHHGWARRAIERAGSKVFNATIGGQLEVYPRADYDGLFRS